MKELISYTRIIPFVSAVLMLVGVTTVGTLADGTEVLGPPSIATASGSGIVAAGTGLNWQPGTITIDVPSGAIVNQVLLYWYGRGNADGVTGDDTIVVDGNLVMGTLIGESLGLPYPPSQVYRADITNLGLISAGSNSLTVNGLDFTFNNNGAGVIVIFDDGSGAADIQIRDGHDFAAGKHPLQNFPDPLDRTVPQTFSFPPSDLLRTATVDLFVGDGEEDRPDAVEITVNSDLTRFENVVLAADGDEWDTLSFLVNIAPGETMMTVQVISFNDPTDVPDQRPDSINWIAAALAVRKECDDCEGGVIELTLRYIGTDEAEVVVFEGKKPKPEKLLFAGMVQPGETFTFNGIRSNGTMGSEISVWVDGQMQTKIHTSCSQPIGPGLVRGDFEVVGGTSKMGGPLCPLPECSECDGGVTRLTLMYTGTSEAEIVVYEGKAAKTEKVLFAGMVQPSETFTFNGIRSNGTMGSEISVWVDGQMQAKIHTSCSQPIGPGLVSGDFEVTNGYSKNGNKLCPLEEPPSADGCVEGIKPQKLTMVYTGQSCAATNHSQEASKVSCSGNPNFASPVHIIANDKAKLNDPKAKVWFSDIVGLGGMVVIDATNAGQTKLRSNTYVHILDEQGQTLQTVKFHTSSVVCC
ncbi:MAG: DUF7467 domain-containing protein [Planctomycetota bacterium]